MNPTHEQIAKKAYEIWLKSGRPEGQGEAHWLQAELALRGAPAARKPAVAAAPKPAPRPAAKKPAPVKRKSA